MIVICDQNSGINRGFASDVLLVGGSSKNPLTIERDGGMMEGLAWPVLQVDSWIQSARLLNW
jgi:hypothetical protein